MPLLGTIMFCKIPVPNTGLYPVGLLDPTCSGSGPVTGGGASNFRVARGWGGPLLLSGGEAGLFIFLTFTFCPHFFHKDLTTISLLAMLSKSSVFLRIENKKAKFPPGIGGVGGGRAGEGGPLAFFSKLDLCIQCPAE